MTRLLALILLLLTALPLRAQESAAEVRDRTFLSGLIEDNLSSVSRLVLIDGFSGALSSQATVRQLSIADADGVWLVAEDLVLDWNRAALFGGALDISSLTAGRISILRAPLPEPAPPPAPEASAFALPSLPVSIRIGQITAARIELGESLLGQAMAFSVTGQGTLAGGIGATQIAATRLDGPEGSFALNAGYSNVTRILSLTANLTEAPDGIVARLLNLPGRPSIALALNGVGPIDDYRAQVTLDTDGVRRVTGTFGQLRVTPDGGAPERRFDLMLAGDLTPLVPPDYSGFFGPNARIAARGTLFQDGTLDLSSLDIATRSLILTGQARFAPDGWPLLLALDGVIGTDDGQAVTLPGGGGVTVASARLSVGYDRAQGPDWTGDFSLDELALPAVLLPHLTLSGGGTIKPADGDAPGAFLAALDYAATGMLFADPALASAIGSEATGTLRVSRADAGPVRIERLTLTGPGITADVTGAIDGPSLGFRSQASVMLDAADLGRFASLTGLALSGGANLRVVADVTPMDGGFTVILSGETTDLGLGIGAVDPYLAGSGRLSATIIRDADGLRAEDVQITTPQITGTAAATLTSGASSARFDLTLADAALALPGLSGPVRLTGTADRAADGAARIVADAALPGVQALFRADVAAAGGVTGQAEVMAADLAAFAGLTGLDLTGAARLNATGAAPATGGFSVTIGGSTTDLALGLPDIDPLLAGEGRIAANLTSLPDGGLRLTGISVTTAALGLTGDGTLDAGGLAATFRAGLDDLGRFVPALPGPVTLTGQVARAPDGAVTMDVTGDLPAGQLRVAGTLDAAGGVFDGQIGADLAQAGVLAGLIGLPLDGAVRGTLTGRVATDLGLINLALQATGQDLGIGIAQVDALLAGPSALAADITGTGLDQISASNVRLTSPALIATGQATLADGAVTAALDARLTDLARVLPGLSGPGALQGSATLSAAQVLTLNLTASGPGAAQIGVRASTDLTQASRTATLDVDVTVADLRPWGALAGQRLGGAASAAISGTATLDGQAFDLRLDARARDLDPGQPLLARLLAGTGTLAGGLSRSGGQGIALQDIALRFANLSANLDLSGTGGAGQARFDARLADIGLFTPDFNGPVTASGTATREANGVWNLNTTATGPGGTSAAISGTVAESGQLGLRITGAAPLSLANGFIEPRRISGTARFELTVNGPPALQSLAGSVQIDGGRISAPSFRAALTDLGGTIRLAAGRATLELTTALDSGGTISIGGGLGLAAPYPADLRLRLAALVLRDPALYDTTASGDVTVTGALTGGARIAGQITLGVTELQVPSSGVGALGPLPAVIHVNPSAAVLQTLARAGLTGAGTEAAVVSGGGAAAYPLDLLISAPSRVFIRGRGLDAELGGSLRLGGTSANVIPSGQLALIRGRLDILQQRFTLSEGIVTLQGGFVPFLRLVARTTARTGTRIEIIVDGPATEPQVIFQSQPELPQDEVMAQLIFGRDLATITPLQAVQLAAAVGTLAGRGGGGVIAGLRQGIGLDDFDIAQDADGNAALRLGKYLTDNIYTDVTVSPAGTEINLNFDITPDITATGSVSTSGEASLGVFFERDY